MFFSVALLFEATHPESLKSGDDPLWEESIILIDATDITEAKSKAQEIARRNQHSYRAISGETVSWRFIRILDTYEIIEDNLKDETEIFSRFLRKMPTNP